MNCLGCLCIEKAEDEQVCGLFHRTGIIKIVENGQIEGTCPLDDFTEPAEDPKETRIIKKGSLIKYQGIPFILEKDAEIIGLPGNFKCVGLD
jgi:hypothetical protein